MSLALEQPGLALVQPWGCPRATDIFGSLRPSPEKTTCFPYRFSGKSRNSGLVPGNRDPNNRTTICVQCLRWPGDSQREPGRFARSDSRELIRRKKNLIFIACKRFARTASNPRFALFTPPPPGAIRRKGVERGNPETIRENQAIRANLRIDSRESDHLRTVHCGVYHLSRKRL